MRSDLMERDQNNQEKLFRWFWPALANYSKEYLPLFIIFEFLHVLILNLLMLILPDIDRWLHVVLSISSPWYPSLSIGSWFLPKVRYLVFSKNQTQSNSVSDNTS